ncbi:unnamed protein product [Didymodactylos carnosus]|uniref:Uncharacterized protein n=1 Tax=Didymodactylos carnosus TaxID=1234261 RepID=A0A815TKS2_9BILA|nr:unnamed protein product [Didymodactylos carnosus]CAF4370785.1 unnamed protein product [Didymodactylos carnosus]
MILTRSQARAQTTQPAPGSTLMTELKEALKSIEVFSGEKGVDTAQWLREVEGKFRCGEAFEWWDLVQANIETWEIFKAQILIRFPSTTNSFIEGINGISVIHL